MAAGSPIPAATPSRIPTSRPTGTSTCSQNDRHKTPSVDHPPMHHRQQQPSQGHAHRYHRGHQGADRQYESRGTGAVTTHITIGGGGSAQSTIHVPQEQPVIHPKRRTAGSHSSSTDMQMGDAQRTADHSSSLAAAAGPNVGRCGPTQLHTHLVIGSDGREARGQSTQSNPTHDRVNDFKVRQQRQYDMHSQEHQHYMYTSHSTNHAAQASNLGGGSYPHRLVIGDYTGHVSAGAKKKAGVGHPTSLLHIPANHRSATSTASGAPASAQLELASEDYDYDLLGGIPSDHHYLSEAVGSGHSAERMEIEDIIPRPPLIVLDGANVAYAYGKAKSSANFTASDHSGGNISAYPHQGSSFGATGRAFQADAEGILIACEYFMKAGCRVQVVLPAPWLQTKSQRRYGHDGSSHYDADEPAPSTSEMSPQLEILHGLREQGLLCAAPANDDDDSYSIMLARREDARAARRRGGGQTSSKSSNEEKKPKSILEQGGGFVLSNDQFRDAQSRDRISSAPSGLDEWLEGTKKGSSRLKDRINNIPGRISYSFGDVGSMDQYGDPKYDLVPNPRHPLIEEIEQSNRTRELSLA